MKEQNLCYGDIERVEVYIGPLDWIVDRPEPKTIEDSKFSLQHVLAAIMLEGDINMDTFTEEKITDKKFIETRSKVKVIVDQQRPRRYMSGIARVDVLTKDKRKLTKEMEQSIGGPKLPLTTEQFVELYKKYASVALSEDQVKQTAEIILNLEKKRDVMELMDILTFRHIIK